MDCSNHTTVVSDVNEVEGAKRYTKTVKWDKPLHYAFLKHMAHAVICGYKRGSTINHDGWEMVIGNMAVENDLIINRRGLKNHYDQCRRFYQGWKELRQMTGNGWNETAKTWELTNSQWEAFFKKHPKCLRLRQWGYDEEAEHNLDVIFSNRVATGDDRTYCGLGRTEPENGGVQNVGGGRGGVAGGTSSVGGSTSGMGASTSGVRATSENGDDAHDYFPSLDADYEEFEDEVEPDVDEAANGGTSQFPRSTSRRNSPIQFPQPPSIPPTTTTKQTRKRTRHADTNSVGESIAMAMSERNEIARMGSLAATEEFEIDQYKKAVDLVRDLPGYDASDPDYSSVIPRFVNPHVRRLWMALGDDPTLRVQSLQEHWWDRY